MQIFFQEKKGTNFSKAYKIEISNICFYSISIKKRFLIQQKFKKKICQIFLKKANKKSLEWDLERKLFSNRTNSEKSKYNLTIGSKFYFYPETFFFFQGVKLKSFYKNKILFNLKNNWNFIENFDFSDFLVYLYFETLGFIPYRFGLYHKKLIRPVFICFREQERNDLLINILNLKNYQSFSFPVSLTVLALRLKPGVLKVVLNGTFGLLFFSLNFGFSSFCPIFLKKNKGLMVKNKI